MIKRLMAIDGWASLSLMNTVEENGKSRGLGRIMYNMIRGTTPSNPKRAMGFLKGIGLPLLDGVKRFAQVGLENALRTTLLIRLNVLTVPVSP
ncbi:MAG: hypothetical protein PHX61_13695 [Alphaproteobacteria bacterium]|nr:hypothetical protein [Alphaproteobacteria bacterium]